MRNDYIDSGPKDIEDGVDGWSQFTVWGGQEMVSGIEDRELDEIYPETLYDMTQQRTHLG